MLHSLTRVLGATQQHRVGTVRRAQRQLIQRQALAASLDNAGTDRRGEAQRGNGHFGDLLHAHVIGDGADEDGNLAFLVGHVASDARNGHGRAVDARHEQTLQDDLVERDIRAAGQEAVELQGINYGARGNAL